MLRARFEQDSFHFTNLSKRTGRLHSIGGLARQNARGQKRLIGSGVLLLHVKTFISKDLDSTSISI
jgi:hypothetical protein